jgi:hypothetical protein
MVSLGGAKFQEGGLVRKRLASPEAILNMHINHFQTSGANCTPPRVDMAIIHSRSLRKRPIFNIRTNDRVAIQKIKSDINPPIVQKLLSGWNFHIHPPL